MTLSKKELQNLTGKFRFTSMRKELFAMGIPFTIRTDGFPIVFQNDLTSHKPSKPKNSWDLHL